MMKSFSIKCRVFVVSVSCAVVLVNLISWMPRSLMTVPGASAKTVANIECQQQDNSHHPTGSGVALIVQGEAKRFDAWRQVLANLSNPSTVTLVYGSYDSPVLDQDCEQDDDCITAFIPNTTWTEGRNQLAKVALCGEEKRGEEFSYFVFADDDVVLECVKQYPCSNPWDRYMDHLMNKMPETGSPVMAMPMGPQLGKKYPDQFGYILTDSYDAFLNAFDRRLLPLLLPYAELPTNFSWWASQAIHFSLMATCFPVSAVVPMDLMARNPKHREYPRGLDPGAIAGLVRDNYHSYVPIPAVEDLGHFTRREGPYWTTTEIASRVSAHLAIVNGTCDPLSGRFEDWKHSFLGEC